MTDNKMPEKIWANGTGFYCEAIADKKPIDYPYQYTLTSTVQAKLDAAEKMYRALVLADRNGDCICAKGRSTVGANILCYICDALANWRRVSGEKEKPEWVKTMYDGDGIK